MSLDKKRLSSLEQWWKSIQGFVDKFKNLLWALLITWSLWSCASLWIWGWDFEYEYGYNPNGDIIYRDAKQLRKDTTEIVDLFHSKDVFSKKILEDMWFESHEEVAKEFDRIWAEVLSLPPKNREIYLERFTILFDIAYYDYQKSLLFLKMCDTYWIIPDWGSKLLREAIKLNVRDETKVWDMVDKKLLERVKSRKEMEKRNKWN